MSDLLVQYLARVYRFALRLTKDPHAAEDLAQETFLRAWSRIQTLRDPRSIRMWLFRITANLWRDQLRRARCRVGQAKVLTNDFPATGPTPDRALADQDELRQALKAMDGLPDRQREALYLSACEGLTAAEIAEVLGIRADAVRVHVCLARQKLRQQLRDPCKDHLPAD